MKDSNPVKKEVVVLQCNITSIKGYTALEKKVHLERIPYSL